MTKPTAGARGLHDSTKTRVIPVFNEILRKYGEQRFPVAMLLRLPGLRKVHLEDGLGRIISRAWSPQEMALNPPIQLLFHLVNELQLVKPSEHRECCVETQRMREALLRKDINTRSLANALLKKHGFTGRKWYELEGKTKPDVYLETERAIIVIEGKRTESGATRDTTWMQCRDQMLRHLDAAYSQAGAKRLYGFYIVEAEKGCLPARWSAEALATLAPKTLKGSLPHRNSAEIDAIGEAFLGATTWQSLVEAFNLPPTCLIETVG